jgi:hypothetical protein
MKKLILIIIFLMILVIPGWAATYYVDTARPNDTGDGLSEGTAWKTLAKVNAMTFSPDDQILFKRGCTWREWPVGQGDGYECCLIVPSGGTVGHPISFGAYGTGANPCFLGSVAVAKGTTWVSDGGNLYHIAKSGIGLEGYYQVWSGWRSTNTSVTIDKTAPTDGSYGYLRRLPSGETSLTRDRDFYADSTNIYVYSTTAPTNYSYEFSLSYYGILVDGPDYVTIQDIDFKCLSRFGVFISENSTHTTINRCGAYACGETAIATLGKYTAIDSCDLYSNADTAIYLVFLDDDGTGETGATDSSITNCTLKYNSRLGGLWAVDRGGVGIQANRCTVTDNWLESNGPEDGSGNIGDAQISSWVANNVNISRNVVIDSYRKGITSSGYPNDYHITIAYNLIIDVNRSTVGGPYAIVADTGGNDSSNWKFKIVNNTMIDKANRGMTGINIYSYTTGDYHYGNQIKNNLMYSANADSYFAIINRDQHGPTTEGTPTPWAMDYNFAYLTGTTHYISFGGDYTLAQWKALGKPTGCGGNQDTHSVGVATDPKFVNAASDWHLQSDSPCINAGVDVGLSTDLDGTAIVGLPDIGAYEYDGGTPSPDPSAAWFIF